MFASLVRSNKTGKSEIKKENQIAKIKRFIVEALQDEDEESKKALLNWATGKQASLGDRYEDLTGRVFGKLTVVSKAPSVKKARYWNVVCQCGKNKIVKGNNLTQGATQSCGCGRDNIKHKQMRNLSARTK